VRECTIFFIDLRAFGKDFEKYTVWVSRKTNRRDHRGRREYGVRYERCMISKVTELQQSKNLRLKYVGEEGEVHEEEFDLVVLAVGLIPASQNQRLAERKSNRRERRGRRDKK